MSLPSFNFSLIVKEPPLLGKAWPPTVRTSSHPSAFPPPSRLVLPIQTFYAFASEENLPSHSRISFLPPTFFRSRCRCLAEIPIVKLVNVPPVRCEEKSFSVTSPPLRVDDFLFYLLLKEVPLSCPSPGTLFSRRNGLPRGSTSPTASSNMARVPVPSNAD